MKITDQTRDYDFELVKSISGVKLKGKTVAVNKDHYQNAKLVSKKELVQAKENFRENAKHELESIGTVFSDDQKANQKKSNRKER